MEPNIMCSIDQSYPAVCCCICEFPLPFVCAEHLAKHPTNTNSFVHFHLPLYASQHINTKDIKAQYDTWLYKLYRAGRLLKENDDELKQFEEQIEATRQEILHEFETEVEQTKQNVANLREAFNTQLEKAIKDTSACAMEQWSPEPGSLSSLIWNFGSNSQWTLKLFGLWIGKQRLGPALQVYIKSSLPSLTQFNQNIDTAKDDILEQTKLELAEMCRQSDDLKTENAKLHQEIQDLQAHCNHLSDTIESLKDSTEVHIKQISKEKDRIQFDCNSEVKKLKLELARLKKTSGVKAKQLTEEINESKSELSNAKLFKDQKEAAFRYQQHSESLRKELSLMQHQSSADQQTANVGLALSEVLGLHLSQFPEAESIIDESLGGITARIPTSEDAMKLWNMKAAIYLHSDRNSDCEAACLRTLKSFANAELDPDLYWTALYYLIFALKSKSDKAESALVMLTAKPLKSTHKLAQFLKICINGRVAQMNGNKREAEEMFKRAARIASEKFPTSIYTAMNLFYLGRLYSDTDRSEKCKVKLLKANSIFAVHFPGSIYSALTLTWLAETLKENNKVEEACLKYIEAHSVFVQYRSSSTSSMSTATNLANLAALYHQQNRLKEAEGTYLQARNLYEAYRPTSDDAAMNLNNLALLYEEMHKIEQALESATFAFNVWSRNNSENAQKLALPLLERLKQSST